MVLSNPISTTVVKFGIPLVEASLNSERQQKLHNRCARIIMNFKDEPGQSQLALDQLGWKSLEERRKHIMARLMFKVVNNLAPLRFSSMFQNFNHIHS